MIIFGDPYGRNRDRFPLHCESRFKCTKRRRKNMCYSPGLRPQKKHHLCGSQRLNPPGGIAIGSGPGRDRHGRRRQRPLIRRAAPKGRDPDFDGRRRRQPRAWSPLFSSLKRTSPKSLVAVDGNFDRSCAQLNRDRRGRRPDRRPKMAIKTPRQFGAATATNRPKVPIATATIRQ